MSVLSWSGVLRCMHVLKRPQSQGDAIHALARSGRGGRLLPSTAEEYLRLAHRLGLVLKDARGRYRLASSVDRPEDLLEVSTLIRLFHAWHALVDEPLRYLNEKSHPLRLLGIRDWTLMRSADALSRHLRKPPEDLPPKALLLLELTRLWAETSPPSQGVQLFSAQDAFQLFEEMLRRAPGDRSLVEQFVGACMHLYGKKRVRLAIVQYATGANRFSAPFRTPLGYIKWIHDPVAHRDISYAEPVPATRKLVSFG